MDTQVERLGRRIDVDIPVTITTVLDSVDAGLIDLSEHGALVVGCGLPEGTRFQLEYRGQTVFAQCRWSEVDRMGARFVFPLAEGPLFERLIIARASQMPGETASGMHMAYSPMQGRPAAPSQRLFARATTSGGFGRRTG